MIEGIFGKVEATRRIGEVAALRAALRLPDHALRVLSGRRVVSDGQTLHPQMQALLRLRHLSGRPRWRSCRRWNSPRAAVYPDRGRRCANGHTAGAVLPCRGFPVPRCSGRRGDGAGGNLAATLCLRLREDGADQPALRVLIYPVTDVSQELASRWEYGERFYLTRRFIKRTRAAYLPPGVDPPA